MSLESCLLFVPQTEFSLLLINNITNFSKTMLCLTIIALFAVSLFLSPGGLAWSLSNLRRAAAIPGPSGLPLLGLLPAFTAGSLPHQTLASLSQSFKAKPLMSFSVGLTRFVVSSHPETARELLNSPAFADRPMKESARELLFHRAMGFAPYGDYWRRLRRISAEHLFSPRRVGGARFGAFRGLVGAGMVERVRVLMGREGEVKVREVLRDGALRNVMVSVFGESFCCGEVEELVREGYELLGVMNWSDHFPLLGLLDLQGVRKRCRKLVVRVNAFVGKIIQEHRLKRVVDNGDGDESGGGDFLHVLLGLEGENSLSDSDMIAVLWVMIFSSLP